MKRVSEKMEDGWVWDDLSLVLTGHAGMIPLNAQFLGRQRTTDVLSFSYPALPGVPGNARAEVIVNVELAVEEGPQHGGAARELALYIAHGCHHLTGADDATPSERCHMRGVENRWLRQAREEGLIAPLEPHVHE